MTEQMSIYCLSAMGICLSYFCLERGINRVWNWVRVQVSYEYNKLLAKEKYFIFLKKYWQFKCPINVNNNILTAKPERGYPLKNESFRMILLCDV